MSKFFRLSLVLLFLSGAFDSATAQTSPYAVDGLALGGKVRFDSQAYRAYHCTPSDKFPGFTWCHKEKTETASRGLCSSNSILHDRDGTAVYVNCYIEPAFFAANDVRAEIDRLSAKFRARAREFRMHRHEGLPDAIIAVWGKTELEELAAADVSIVASGGTIKGLLVSFLGDLQRSAKTGVPVYRLAGGPGFLWAASFNEEGRGTLRFLTIDASQMAAPNVVQNPEVKPQSAASPLPPRSGGAEITVSRMAFGDTLVRISGQIELGDEAVFAEKTKSITQPASTLVWLASRGGNFSAGLEIAKIVRDRGFSTVINRAGYCMSVCPLIWFSGRHAIIQRNSLLVFHMPYDLRDGKPSPEGIAQMIEYLQSVGLTEAQARFLANAAAPSEGWVATEAAAYALGFRPQYILSPFAGRNCQAKFCLAIP